MSWLFKPNSVIDETIATTKKRKFFVIGLTFLLVYYIATFMSRLIIAIPTYIIAFSDERFMSFIAEMANKTDFDAYMQEYQKSAEAILTQIVDDNMPLLNLFSLFGTLATIVVVIFYCCKIEKRRLFTLGFARKCAFKEYIYGLIVGLLMFSATYGIMLLSGEVESNGFDTDISVKMVLLYLLGFIIQGASEEILLRGYFFVSCAANTNVTVSILASSALFAAMHISNPGFSLLAFINLFLFGVFASLYFLRRGSIWGICALHTIWNFAQGNIFGCSVSGMPLEDTLLLTRTNSGMVWSGGEFGPEGGVAVTIIYVIGIAVLTFMNNKDIDEFFVRKEQFVSDYIYN